MFIRGFFREFLSSYSRPKDAVRRRRRRRGLSALLREHVRAEQREADRGGEARRGASAL